MHLQYIPDYVKIKSVCVYNETEENYNSVYVCVETNFAFLFSHLSVFSTLL